MISDSELDVLRAYDNPEHNRLSVYLRLDTPDRRQAAYEHFLQQVRLCLDSRDPRRMLREIIQEDIEITSQYINCNADRSGAGLAIFSCASDLFWRAYSLPIPIPSQVAVGPRFDIEPLLQAVTS
ncbi:MAG: hypothetical protein PVF77_17945 [Anaerolineae bacterium]